MKLSAEQIQSNWIEFNTNIETFITGGFTGGYIDGFTNANIISYQHIYSFTMGQKDRCKWTY